MNLASHHTLRKPVGHTIRRHPVLANLSQPLWLGAAPSPLRARKFPARALAPSGASVRDGKQVTDDSASARIRRGWLVQSLLLEAITLDTGGDPTVAQALERALDLAERDGVLLPFLVHPVPQLLERHASGLTDHADLIAQIFTLGARQRPDSPPHEKRDPSEPLTESEARVLRYLPTNLSKREIADELCVSVHTVKTHVKHLYAKLDAHSRREAVQRARALGLVAGPGRSR